MSKLVSDQKIKACNRIIQDLLDGNQRFREGRSDHSGLSSIGKLRHYAKNAQLPKAIILCCSDSRAPVELIFDQDIGDLFVIRVAGNIIAPSLVGSVEYALSAFGTGLIIVMGHTNCGAIGATLDHIENPQAVSSENIHDIISRIKPHIFPVMHMKELTHDERVARSTEMNVLASVAQLSHSSRLIEKLVIEEKILIRGAIFNLETGEVGFLETV